MGKIREYIDKIGDSRDVDKMEHLGDMLEELICDLKESHHDMYEHYKMKLYEMAYGKIISEEMAHNWVEDMKPVGQHWTMEETTNAMHDMGYSLKEVDFYIVANLMMNDYYDIVKDNEELALKMANDFLNDKDAIDDKLYEYWKHIPKR